MKRHGRMKISGNTKEANDMTDPKKNKPAEMVEDQLSGVSGGNHVKMDSRMVRYCPGCGKLASVVTGKVVDKMFYEKGGCYFVDVQSDCCGHVERALESICSVQ